MQIDQPVGTGFSYADSIWDYPVSEEQVSKDLYQFLQLFLKRNPKYASLPFYIIGYARVSSAHSTHSVYDHLPHHCGRLTYVLSLTDPKL